ncbi:MAG TPA: Dabb family protein [Pseudomonadales bacterium]|jgi:hypothetical protein
MIQHVVLLNWKAGTTPEQIARVTAGFNRLPGLIPEIKSYRYGPDLGLTPNGGADYALVAEFSNADDFAAYAMHADHIAVMQESIGDMLASWKTVQFQL